MNEDAMDRRTMLSALGASVVSWMPRRYGRITLPTIARLQYDGGGDWYNNPSSLPNLLRAIRRDTNIRVDVREARVSVLDPVLWSHPYLYVTGHGNIRFSDAEISRLRRHLEQGGFLHVDDCYGLDASFRREIVRVYPNRPLVDVPLSHPIYTRRP